jgi:hypothetical protein
MEKLGDEYLMLGLGKSKDPDPGSGMNYPGSYFLDLRNHYFGLKFFDADPGSGMEKSDPGSGMRDGKKSDPGSGINIPDPQHC